MVDDLDRFTVDGTLSGLTVLVVEDEYLQAMDIADFLSNSGAIVIGPCRNNGDAETEIAKADLTAAVLDIHLGDGPCFTVATKLKARGVPFVFVSGYDHHLVPVEFANVPFVQKPFEADELTKAMNSLKH